MSKNDNSVLPLTTEQEMTLTDNEKPEIPPADELFIKDASVRTCCGGKLQPGRTYKSLGPG